MTDNNEWTVGKTSARFESAGGNAGTVSSGRGDHGGVSYGTYQLASGPGTVKEYLRQSRFGPQFHDLEPATAGFNAKWVEVARDNPDFGADQHDFIRKTHVDPVVSSLANKGIDVEGRGPAVQDLVWSTAVQYRGNSARIFERGLKESFGDDYDFSSLSDVDVVRAVQQSKLLHVNQDFRSSDARVREGVETRIPTESAALVRLAETGETATNADFTKYWNHAVPVHRGSPESRVIALQERLAEAGMLNDAGQRIVADGSFGPSTEQAVKSFQRSVGVPDSGQAGALTMHMLDEQLKGRRAAVEAQAAPEQAPQARRLDDQGHPDHAFFNQVRGHVVALDQTLGRAPDQYTDNIASALTVQARSDGLHRIDSVALSTGGDQLWGVQRVPGRTDNLFNLSTSVPTAEAMTPMDQSGARWPEAIQNFHGHEQERVQSEQRAIERNQTESQSNAVSGPSMSL